MTPLAARSLAGLFEQSTGQQLATGRRWRIETVLQPVMRGHGISSLDMLAARAAQPGSHMLRDTVVEALLNHETSFYRDATVFRCITEEALPRLAETRRDRRLRIWSAGCSTGQEVYSLAMLLAAESGRWGGWSIELLGTDFSASAVAQARSGTYSQLEVQRGLPIGQLLAHFDQDGDSWRVRTSLNPRVGFMAHNLLDPPPPGRFDLILCRNVLLYFGTERRRRVLDGLARALTPDGLLVLGAGETVLDTTEAFVPDPVLRGFYRKAGPPAE